MIRTNFAASRSIAIATLCLVAVMRPITHAQADDGLARFTGDWKAAIELSSNVSTETSDRKMTISPPNSDGWIGFVVVLRDQLLNFRLRHESKTGTFTMGVKIGAPVRPEVAIDSITLKEAQGGILRGTASFTFRGATHTARAAISPTEGGGHLWTVVVVNTAGTEMLSGKARFSK